MDFPTDSPAAPHDPEATDPAAVDDAVRVGDVAAGSSVVAEPDATAAPTVEPGPDEPREGAAVDAVVADATATPESSEAAPTVADEVDLAAPSDGDAAELGNDDAPPDVESRPAPPRPGGTILIPAGMTRRSEADAQPEGEGVESAEAEATAVDEAPVAVGEAEADAAPPVEQPSLPGLAGSVPSVPPYITSGGSIPPSVVEAVRRKEEIERRRHRRRSLLLFGGLSSVVVALLVVLAVVLLSRGNARAEAEKRFFAAHQVALTTAGQVDAGLAKAMKKAAEAPKMDLAPLASLAEQSGRKLRSLALPSAEGKLAPASARLRTAVEEQGELVRAVRGVASRPVVELDATAVERVEAQWDSAADALAAAYEDNPELPRPPFSSWASTVEDFVQAAIASGERARANAAALAAIEAYRSQVQPLLDRYEQLRTQLGQYEARKKTVVDSADYARITGFFEGAASARFALASQLEAVTPPSAFVSLHSGLVGTIRRLASEVRGVQQAVSEAYCYGFTEECSTIGDTVTYKQYVTTTNVLAEEFARTKSSWAALIEQEVKRLS